MFIIEVLLMSTHNMFLSSLKHANIILTHLNPLLCSKTSIYFPGVYIIFAQTLRKHAYSNILKILPPKNETFR